MKNLIQIAFCGTLLLIFGLATNIKAQKFTLSTGANLVLNKNVSLVLQNGDFINNGSFISGNQSAVYLKGNDSFRLKGTSVFDLNNLHIDNSASLPLTISTPVSIKGVLRLVTGSSKIVTNDLLTIKSTVDKTASIASIPSGGNVIGKVTVERFLAAKRAWRLLSVPLSSEGAPTIKGSWQENAESANHNPAPGFGTHITGATAPNNGFDYNPTKSVSCKEFNSGSWSAISNTDVQKITDQSGYMLFVRGSRANQLSMGTGAQADNTILRAKGNLNIGNVEYPINANGYTLIGNPYAATIDFASITKTEHVLNSFYIWDPFLTGGKCVGGYVTVSYNGSGYDITSCVSDINQYIPSGAAFLMSSNGNAGTIIIKETDKSIEGVTNSARPSNRNGTFRANLYVVNNDSSQTLYDGVLVGFGNDYSNSVDGFDAIKLTSGAESIAILRYGKMLSIERRQPLGLSLRDTINLKLIAMTVKNYKLTLISSQLDNANRVAVLLDRYLNTEAPVNMDGTSEYFFSVNTNPASYAENRFTILFNTTSTLAVNNVNLNALLDKQDVLLTWQTADVNNINEFTIERSLNGVEFNLIRTLKFSDCQKTNDMYCWKDILPNASILYYRVAAVSNSGEKIYSSVKRIEMREVKPSITLASTILTSNFVSVEFSEQKAGEYSIYLKNSSGQLVATKTLSFEGGTSIHQIYFDKLLGRGVYFMTIVNPLNEKITFKVSK